MNLTNVTTVHYHPIMALIPPFFLNTVVAIGNRDAQGAPHWVATGFFVGQQVSDQPGRYYVYLATNRHVYEKLIAPVIRLNPLDDSPAGLVDLILKFPDGTPAWRCHPNPMVDIAMTLMVMDSPALQPYRRTFFELDHHCLSIEGMKSEGVSEGSAVAVLGFPMGIVGGIRNSVIVRSGTVAQLGEVYGGFDNKFLIDATILPGNSGGPVILLPEAIAIEGTKNLGRAALAGIACAFLPYIDTAVSIQTDRPRITFEENSGLAQVFPVDSLMQTIATFSPQSPEQAV